MISSFDQTPDKPQAFGYKVSWFAVKATDPAIVIDVLQVSGATPANWASGLAVACPDEFSSVGDRWIFVTPPSNGWVLVVGSWLPYPTLEAHHDIGRKFDVLYSRLMARFDDVQFFGSHRVSDFCAWARAVKGTPTRIFVYADGQVLMNLGDQTSDEAKLGLPNLTGLSPSDAGDAIFRAAEELDAEEEKLIASGLSEGEARTKVRAKGRHAFPDESDVIELAGIWSVDPTQLADDDHPAGVGLAAVQPEIMSQ
jgi:hypothetical protein